jgi:hypothetical protein
MTVKRTLDVMPVLFTAQANSDAEIGLQGWQ